MSVRVLDIAVQLAAILFAISFHESAHAWTALKFGDPTARDQGRISLNPLHHIDPFGTILLPILCVLLHAPIFGYARPTPVNLRNTTNPRAANFWVSVAGPGSNVLAGAGSLALLLGVGRVSPDTVALLIRGAMPGGILAPVAYVLLQLVIINVILAVFNLIPIPPMDGSGILFSILGRRGLALELFFHRHAMLMFLVIILLLNFGFFTMILSPVLNGIFRIIARGTV
jgi:Zn-dependent protease